MNKIYDNFNEEITDSSIVVLCVIRDEEYLIDTFMQHYISLGVTHFFFVDNGSIDSSIVKIREYKNNNVIIIKTTQEYSKNLYGVNWIRNILNKYLQNKQCITVDIDELIILPPEIHDLNQLFSLMKDNDCNLCPTMLLDVYKSESNNLYYDSMCTNIHKTINENIDTYIICGGLRERLSPKTNDKDRVCLSKQSIFIYDFCGYYTPSVGYHTLIARNKNNSYMIKPYIYILLLHLKFLRPNFIDFIKLRIERNQDWKNSIEYKDLLSSISNHSLYDQHISKPFTPESAYKDYYKMIYE